jgi:hypothetical protein
MTRRIPANVCEHTNRTRPPPGRHLDICLYCAKHLIDCSYCGAVVVAGHPSIREWHKVGLDALHWYFCPGCGDKT